MRGMICVAILGLITLPIGAADDKNEAAGWVSLLEGGDLGKHIQTEGNWKLDDKGVVTLTPRKGESGWTRWKSYLWAKQTYTDFEIEFEYMVQKGGNSGFYFRVGDVNEPVKTGIEVQIVETGSKPKADKLTDHHSGALIPSIPPTKDSAKPAGEWNKFHITSKGDKLTVVLNGVTVNEVDLAQAKLKDRPRTGSIGFQDHGLPLSLRNIRVRDLSK